MRVSRAYLAGFGTAGCLIAAAAVLFTVASAVVSFRGAAQVSAQARVSNVTLPDATNAASVTPSARVLTAFGGPGGGVPATGNGAIAPGARPGHGGGPGSQPILTGTQTTTAPSTQTSTTPSGTTTPGAQPTSTSTTSPPPRTTPAEGQLGSDVTTVGTNLSGGVSTTANNLTSGVSKVAGDVSGVVTKVSPNLGGAVSNVSNTVTTVLNDATTGVSTGVTNLTGALGRLLGRN